MIHDRARTPIGADKVARVCPTGRVEGAAALWGRIAHPPCAILGLR